MIFDDSNLFRVNKFAGWDRVEGGGRANYGVQYTAQFNKAGFVNALFGQSYQLFGQNSFAVRPTSPIPGSTAGSTPRRSDYVARVTYQPNSIYRLHLALPLRQGQLRREAAGTGSRRQLRPLDRCSMLYGDYAAQPDIGFLDRRQGILGPARSS